MTDFGEAWKSGLEIKISHEKLKSDKKSGTKARFLHFYAAIPAKARDKTSGYISRKFS